MTLMLSQLIDDLEGRVPRSRLLFVTGEREPLKAATSEFIDLAHQAEKFDFGELPFEETGNIVQGRSTWMPPTITPTEKGAWDDGLIPLPSPICWYEFLLGHSRSGLLVRNLSRVEVQRVDYSPKQGLGVFHGCWTYPKGDAYVAFGPPEALTMVDKLRQKTPVMNLGADHHLAVYLTLMLNSRTTEKSMHVPSAALNKARERRGDEPLHVHRIVNLVPRRFIYSSSGQGTHSSPRLHWRRSHLRTFDHATPGSKFIEGRGWCTLIPRSLIGKEEVGTVEHEYKVRA